MARLWALLFLLVPALASGHALDPLREHPLLRQAQALLEAARKGLEAQAAPLAFNLQGNYARLGYECTPASLCPSLPATGGSLTLALVLTPFPFGETADGLARAQIAYRRAELGYRKALTALQAQAVAAYGRYQLALLGEKLAQKGRELAQTALEAARKRQANPKELREAELALKEAENRLLEAQRNVELAKKGAEGLVDLTKPLPEIPPPQGTTPLALEEARLSLEEARIAYAASLRTLFPEVKASYLLYPSGNDTLALSLSSRNLQPTLAYTRQDPGQRPTSLPGGSYRTAEELRLSLSLTLTPGLFAALEAAAAQVRGAEEALKAAERQARLQGETLESSLRASRLALELARLRQEAGKKALEEAVKRLELGLESPLALLQAELSLLQAELALAQAENDLRNKWMELYQFYGELLPEVTP
ncbi:TolC family protein [Thermus amyloliquefaciens]|uniref:TolC family protein n=1 Tax=Thermus amyloliquefaciens TaxID=1449080 RepID=UPI00056FD02B|nr:TolC family protein [Thermus amyloliquefaciens]